MLCGATESSLINSHMGKSGVAKPKTCEEPRTCSRGSAALSEMDEWKVAVAGMLVTRTSFECAASMGWERVKTTENSSSQMPSREQTSSREADG